MAKGVCVAKGGMCGKGGACVAKGGVRGEGGHVWQMGHAWQRGCVWHTPPSRTPRDTVGQCAAGTHPTGIHTCSFCGFSKTIHESSRNINEQSSWQVQIVYRQEIDHLVSKLFPVCCCI